MKVLVVLALVYHLSYAHEDLGVLSRIDETESNRRQNEFGALAYIPSVSKTTNTNEKEGLESLARVQKAINSLKKELHDDGLSLEVHSHSHVKDVRGNPPGKDEAGGSENEQAVINSDIQSMKSLGIDVPRNSIERSLDRSTVKFIPPTFILPTSKRPAISSGLRAPLSASVPAHADHYSKFHSYPESTSNGGNRQNGEALIGGLTAGDKLVEHESIKADPALLHYSKEIEMQKANLTAYLDSLREKLEAEVDHDKAGVVLHHSSAIQNDLLPPVHTPTTALRVNVVRSHSVSSSTIHAATTIKPENSHFRQDAQKDISNKASTVADISDQRSADQKIIHKVLADLLLNGVVSNDVMKMGTKAVTADIARKLREQQAKTHEMKKNFDKNSVKHDGSTTQFFVPQKVEKKVKLDESKGSVSHLHGTTSAAMVLKHAQRLLRLALESKALEASARLSVRHSPEKKIHEEKPDTEMHTHPEAALKAKKAAAEARLQQRQVHHRISNARILAELERRHEWEAMRKARDEIKKRTDRLEAEKAVERMRQRKERSLQHLELEKAREEATAKKQRALVQRTEQEEANLVAKEAIKEKMEKEKEEERRAEVRSRVHKDLAKVQLHELAAAKALAARHRQWKEAERRREQQREAAVAKRRGAFRAALSRRSSFAAVEKKLLRDKERELADLEKEAALARAGWTGGTGAGLKEARLEALQALGGVRAGLPAVRQDEGGSGGRQALLEEDSAAGIRARYRAARRQVVAAKAAERLARLRMEHARSARILGKAVGPSGKWEMEEARSALAAAEHAVARDSAAEHALQHRLYESEGA